MDEVKMDRAARWERRKAKHRGDYAHCPGGFISGNARYKRNARNPNRGNFTMGKARMSIN